MRPSPAFPTPLHSMARPMFIHMTFRNWLVVCALIFALSATSTFAQEPPDPAAQPKTPLKQPGQTDPAKSNLPSDFDPPRAIPPVMTHNEELLSEKESKDLYDQLRRMGNYKLIFRNARLNDNSKEIIQTWAKWRLYQMTLKSNRKRLHEIRADLMNEINYAGQSSNVPRDDVEEFRYFLCDEVTKRATELLKNNFYVRLNAALVLAHLNLTDERNDIPEQAYAKAAIPLMDVLKAETGGGLDEQLEAVKIQAAIGLKRINLLGPPSDLNTNINGENFRNLMADTLIAELQDPNAHSWYQKRLIDALAAIDLVNDINSGRPIILQQLGEVLADDQRPFRVRARAARGLGRCELPASLNTQKLVFQILLLEHEMALAYQKDPNAYYWLDSFVDVYYAFHPVNTEEIELFGNRRQPGLIRKQPPLGSIVNDAFDVIKPITKNIIEQPGWRIPRVDENQQTSEDEDPVIVAERPDNQPLPDRMIADLAQWLQDNQPANHKLAPNLPELAPMKPVPGGDADTTASE